MYRQTRDAGFGPEVKRRIMLGTYALSAGYYDAYYLQGAEGAHADPRRLRRRPSRSCDVIAAPTAPTPAFRIGEKVDDPLAMYLSDIFTIAGEPRRAAGPQRAVRLRRRPGCRSACS